MSTWFSSYGFAEVTPGLIVGAYPLDDDDVHALQKLGVQWVLNLVEDAEYPPGVRSTVGEALAQAGIEEARLPLTDFGALPGDSIDLAVELVCGWLEQGLVGYVHCRAGWQRSAAIAAAVIATRTGIDIEAALTAIRRRKPRADPLPHQREDLLHWWADR